MGISEELVRSLLRSDGGRLHLSGMYTEDIRIQLEKENKHIWNSKRKIADAKKEMSEFKQKFDKVQYQTYQGFNEKTLRSLINSGNTDLTDDEKSVM